ncbi:3-dehydroquinate synthase [Virgibacillus kekensis]|uniref:3-dehydroquinate synthase n=1 Tax=Virgibacillus kekensis TaxID=202261 RepID=A0ABV9DHQ4_9BACI
MNVTKVRSSTNTYKVYIGEGLLEDLKSYLPKKYTSIMIVTDSMAGSYYLDKAKKGLAGEKVVATTIPAGEKSKSIQTFYNLHTDALNYGLDRQSLILALGGGVVGDLAGFVAATYMRGIDFIQVPTTILAHDSSVGGKVAINHEQGKNMIGSFYPPINVVYDVSTLFTLERKEIRSGYAEIAKEALIADRIFFQSLMEIDLFDLSNDQLASQIGRGVEIKASIVEADERESGVRKHLNFGHTLGHALESMLGYGEWTHGELVAIGMLFALRVSEDVFGTTLPYTQLHSWLRKNDYPLNLPDFEVQQIIEKMKIDKKTIGRSIQMVLLRDVGAPVTVQVDDNDMVRYLKSFMNDLKKI